MDQTLPLEPDGLEMIFRLNAPLIPMGKDTYRRPQR